MSKQILVASATFIVAVLMGCGGNTEKTKLLTKVIMDDPIVGLHYECAPSGKKDITGDQGDFTCNIGDSITFSVGKYVIGKTKTYRGTADTMRIADLGITPAAVTDVRQLLQSIDSIAGDGRIMIPEDFDALDDMTEKPGDENFENVVAKLIGTELVGEESANKRANEAYLKRVLAGKIFYTVQAGGGCESGDDSCEGNKSNSVETIQFSPALIRVEKMDNSKEHSALLIDGDTLILADMGHERLKIKSTHSEYIEIEMYHQTGVSPYATWYYFTDKTKAEAYLKDGTLDQMSFRDLLADGTFYLAGNTGMKKAVFDVEFKQIVTTKYEDTELGSISETNSITLKEGKLIINSKGDYITYHSSHNNYLLFHEHIKTDDQYKQRGEEVRFYFNETEAKDFYLANHIVKQDIKNKTLYFVRDGSTCYTKLTYVDENHAKVQEVCWDPEGDSRGEETVESFSLNDDGTITINYYGDEVIYSLEKRYDNYGVLSYGRIFMAESDARIYRDSFVQK